MPNDRTSTEYQQWRQKVRKRDRKACRVCNVQRNIHVHHIKPFKKYPDFVTDIDNGITLCGNCHTLFRGKEESTNLQTIIEAVKGHPDGRTANQLRRLNSKFCAYLEPRLKSSDPNIRNNTVYQLFVQLQIYPDSLDQFLPLIQHLLYGKNRSEEELATQIAVEFLKDSSSRMASQILNEYKKRTEVERPGAEAAHWRRDYPIVLKRWQPLAERGDANAQFRLGSMYKNGRGVPQDDTEAVKWYRKAAQQGYALAQCHLGWMYANGKGVVQNDTEAIKWYQKAAQQGNALAQCHLGFTYEKGKGVAQDYTEAAKWYRKAAQQGNLTAQNNLGVMYENGEKIFQNDAEAVKWYQKAAQQGNATAQYNLGRLYAKGIGVEQNDGEAVKWYQKAAQQGNTNARNALAERQ